MPPILRFPDPTATGPEGIVAVGGDLHPESLLRAYRRGIFPWPIFTEPGEPAVLAWFCPPDRGILDFSDLRVPRSLARSARRRGYTFSCDRAFDEVIAACQAAPRPGQPGTWITEGVLASYRELHRLGIAHSIEAWNTAGKLVGGLYGVYLDGAFAGESMFHRAPDASKLALLHAIERLREAGIDWIDIQVLTPHMEALGARLIPRDEFLERLRRTHARFRGLPCPLSAPAR